MSYVKTNATLRINDYIIDFDNYQFSWRYSSTDDDNPNFLEINIPNLSKQFISEISKNAVAIFNFGDNGILGTLINGYVDKIETVNQSVVTSYTNIKIIEVSSDVFTIISKGYAYNTKSSDIIKDIVNSSGLYLELFELKNDIVHKNGYVVVDKAMNALRSIVSSCGSNLYVEGNSVFIYNTEDSKLINPQTINYSNRLLEEPKEFSQEGKEYEYKIKLLATTEIKKNTVIRIESETINSYCKILSYEINDFIGEYSIKLLEV